MNYEFKKISEEHRKPVIDIFNFFVEKGFAAYPEEKVPYEFFDMMLKMTQGYPAIVVVNSDSQDQIIGFAFTRCEGSRWKLRIHDILSHICFNLLNNLEFIGRSSKGKIGYLKP